MKWVNKIKLRTLKFNNDTYLWKTAHYHLEEFEFSKCAEKVIIYLEGFKNAPLHLHFRAEDNLLNEMELNKKQWCIGYPDTGVIWLSEAAAGGKHQPANIHINLNRPAVIKKLIEHFRAAEWQPEERRRPLIIENALLLLEQIDLPIGVN